MVVYVCMVLYLRRDWFCVLIGEKAFVWEEFCHVHLLMTEFDCPEVNVCGWQGVKFTNYCLFMSVLISVLMIMTLFQGHTTASCIFLVFYFYFIYFYILIPLPQKQRGLTTFTVKVTARGQFYKTWFRSVSFVLLYWTVYSWTSWDDTSL